MDESEITASTDSASQFATQTPRVSIFHLMLWTLCSAVALAAARALHSHQPTQYDAIGRMLNLIHGIIQGAILAGAIVLGYSRFRFGPPLLRQPGHWLLLVPVAMTIFDISLCFIMARFEFSSFEKAYFVLVTTLQLAQAAAYFVATRQIKVVRWRIHFWALVMFGLLRGFVYLGLLSELYGVPSSSLSSWHPLLLTIIPWGNFVLGGSIIAVAILDLTAGQRRDWLHWTGVVMFLSSVALMLMWDFWSWLFP